MGAFSFMKDNARFLLAGALLMFTSSYGQTYFISIFAGEIMLSFSLTDGEWGGIYTLGTTSSAIVMFWAGALTDRFRVRTLAWTVLPCLAVACVIMAWNTYAAGLVLCIFLLRLFGQGMTFQLAAVAMARWFVGRRGLALSLSALGFAFGQAVLPVLFASLLEWTNWRNLWLLAAAMTMMAFPLLLWLLTQERTPQSLAESSEAFGMEGRHWTRPEVVKSPFFWMLMPMLLGPPAWGTSLFFQQVHIAEVKGWDLVSYLSLIPIMTMVSVATTLISGQLVDRFGTARLIQIYLLPFMAGFVILAFSATLTGAFFAFLFFGLATGLQATIITAFWAEFFGTRHIGAIKATSTSVMVFGSAIGPGISGALIDLGYDFPDQMIAISVYFAFAMSLVWIAVSRAKLTLPVARKINVERA